MTAQAQPFAIVQKTFEVVTTASVAMGEAEDRGFIFEDEPMTLGELIQELKQLDHLSSTHVDGRTWAIGYPQTDYRTGDETTESIHVTKILGKEPTAKQLQRIYRLAKLTRELLPRLASAAGLGFT